MSSTLTTTTPFPPLVNPIADVKSGIVTTHWNAYFQALSGRLAKGEQAAAAPPPATDLTFDNLGLHIRDQGPQLTLTLQPLGNYSVNRVLGFALNDANRTITFVGSPTLGDWFNQSVKTTASPIFAGLTVNALIAKFLRLNPAKHYTLAFADNLAFATEALDPLVSLWYAESGQNSTVYGMYVANPLDVPAGHVQVIINNSTFTHTYSSAFGTDAKRLFGCTPPVVVQPDGAIWFVYDGVNRGWQFIGSSSGSTTALPGNIAYIDVANAWSVAQTFPRVNITDGSADTVGAGLGTTGLFVQSTNAPHISIREAAADIEATMFVYAAYGGAVGMRTNHPFNIRTNDTDRLHIDNSGYGQFFGNFYKGSAAIGSQVNGINGMFAQEPSAVQISARDTVDGVELGMIAFTSSGALGTWTNHPLVIRTNNIPRATFATDGSAGFNGALSTGGPITVPRIDVVGGGYGLINVNLTTEVCGLSFHYPGVVAWQFGIRSDRLVFTPSAIGGDVLGADRIVFAPGDAATVRVSGSVVCLASSGFYDPGDGIGPSLRMGYNASGDYGFIEAIQTGIAGKNLRIQTYGNTQFGGPVTMNQPYLYVGGFRVDVTANCSIPGAGGGVTLPPNIAYTNQQNHFGFVQYFDGGAVISAPLTINGFGVTVNGPVTLNDWFDQSVKTGASPTFNNLNISNGITASTISTSGNVHAASIDVSPGSITSAAFNTPSGPGVTAQTHVQVQTGADWFLRFQGGICTYFGV